MMGITSILAIVGVIETLIKDAPEAVALWQQVKAMITTGQEPTQDQWSALDAQLTAAHTALQSA